MAREPNLLGLEPRVLAGLKDFYETTMLDTNVWNGIKGRTSVFNVAARGLRRHKVVDERIVNDERGAWECCLVEPDNYLLNAGTEQALAMLQRWELMEEHLRLFEGKGLNPETIRYLDAHRKLDLTVWAIPEGIPVFGHEPVLSVEGTFERCQLPESLLIGTLGYQTAVATQASYVKNILAEFGRGDVITLEGGSRRVYPGAQLAASRAALVGGFDGTSLEQLGVEYPELAARVGGSSGHSEILHIGSEEHAFEYQARAYYKIREGDSPEAIRQKIAAVRGVGPTFLIDTFNSREGLEAAMRVMKKYGIPCQVRNDSGDQLAFDRHARARFTEEGLEAARIMISDDLKPWKVYRLLQGGATFNLLLMGTYLVNPYKLPGAVYKVAADERGGRMEDVCKVSLHDPAKSTLPGRLDVYRIIGTGGKADRDIILARGEDVRTYLKAGEHPLQLNQPVMERGRLVYDVPDMNAVRETARYHLGLLRDEHKRFRGAVAYPVTISDRVQRTQRELASAVGKGGV